MPNGQTSLDKVRRIVLRSGDRPHQVCVHPRRPPRISSSAAQLILGLLTVLVFSVGFASVLIVVGVVAARVGQLILTWLSSRWVGWVQLGAALLIVIVGLVLTANAWRTVVAVS